MLKLTFEYHSPKAARNLRKHKVTFSEALTAFFDTNAISYPDEEHSSPGDERFIHIGLSSALRLLFVVHNEDDGEIRIISARPVTPAERALYEEA